MLSIGARRALESRDFSIGEQLLAQHALEKRHPVVLVPGIVSTGLESWSTENVARGFFRKRLWVYNLSQKKFDVLMKYQGTSTMIRVSGTLIRSNIWLTWKGRQSLATSEMTLAGTVEENADRLNGRERWLAALSIDPETGLDPPGYKVRAAQGLDAAVSIVLHSETIADS